MLYQQIHRLLYSVYRIASCKNQITRSKILTNATQLISRVFNAGIDPDPVMCQTINTTLANNCGWASCGEWCLTRTTGFCPQIHATVRRNGTDIVFENCTNFSSISCPQVRYLYFNIRWTKFNPLRAKHWNNIGKSRIHVLTYWKTWIKQLIYYFAKV